MAYRILLFGLSLSGCLGLPDISERVTETDLEATYPKLDTIEPLMNVSKEPTIEPDPFLGRIADVEARAEALRRAEP